MMLILNLILYYGESKVLSEKIVREPILILIGYSQGQLPFGVHGSGHLYTTFLNWL